ncbi:MAG: hypothetical protein WCS42_13325, partial [Verrucomicrobiota bacterium]
MALGPKQSSCRVASPLLKNPVAGKLKRFGAIKPGHISGRKLTTTTITHMAKYKLEYIWLDGYEPVPNLRGKTQIKEFKAFPKLEELP